MKLKLHHITKNEIDWIIDSNDEDLDITRKLYREWINQVANSKFNIGDIVISYSLELDDNNNIVKVYDKYDDSDLCSRFVVCYIDNNDIPWGRLLFLDGPEDTELGNDLYPLLDLDLASDEIYNVFEIDPLQVEAQIVGQTYDVLKLLEEEYKRINDIKKMNKSQTRIISSLKEANEFLEQQVANKSDYIYFQANHDDPDFLSGLVDHQVELPKKLTKHKAPKNGTKIVSDNFICHKEKFSKKSHNCDYYYTFDCNGGHIMSSFSLVDHVVYDSKPICTSSSVEKQQIENLLSY